MGTLFVTIHYWLVDHPIVSQYEWKPNYTPGASPFFVFLAIATYLSLTLFLRYFPLLPTLSPAALRLITVVHNFILCVLSLLMAVGCTLSSLHQTPPDYLIWPICFPVNNTPRRGPTFFWGHVFYFSKILEFIDTLLILLSGSRARRLSFLHVYHHAVVLVMCYVWIETAQSLFPVALVTNATVHVVMYAYYLLCAVGIRPWWKRFVTDFQIIQFVFSFLISGWMLYHHFSGPGCEGIWGWCFNAVFNGSLLALFGNFHLKNYANKRSLGEDKDKVS
ncbi:Fatty acyl-CoA elongase/Polyunsaturated fatty acid specific elongation enzyme [Handroanthus impetiginosus]|uniref:very-long-chain 3-oxoacyl-CoA synthase n=1 Tax=Handroanthus impetiginosus TaxID=429701 RepID=A0A2G9HRA0_9LAMI|nr:Fatty acyl-CoA elongase/Polyunsaturated fatty acid specific elongation enzyme [Handroanthus impetiginosus]